MGNGGVGPALQFLHAVDRAHPFFLVRHHVASAQKFFHLGPRQHPLYRQHFGAGGPGQIAELIVGAFRQDEMDLLERVQQRERVGDHGGVGIFLEEASRGGEQVVECLDEFRPAVGRIEIRNGLAHERQPVMMHVLMRPARHRQPAVFILDEAPDQIVQRPQGIEFEFP